MPHPAPTFRLPLLLAILLCLTACALAPPAPPEPAPTSAAETESEQSRVTPLLSTLVADLADGPVADRLAAMLRRVSERFVFDPWQNGQQLDRTADDLAQGRALGGCGDYALIELALVRAMGLKGRLVVTADADWLSRYRADGLSVASGHAFVEVQTDDGRWFLLDPTYFVLYDHYQPGQSSYPHRQLLVARGTDFWSLGIKDVEALDNRYTQAALAAPTEWHEPPLHEAYRLAIDPPQVLTRAGEFFLAHNRHREAHDRLDKALTQAPEYGPALLARGRLLFAEHNFTAALADFSHLRQLAPTDPTPLVWQGHTHHALGRRDLMCAALDQACDLGHCQDLEWARDQQLCPAGVTIRLR